MPHLLSKDLSFCEVNGTIILLDIAQDRYFRLNQRLEASFRSYLKQADLAPELLFFFSSHRIPIKADHRFRCDQEAGHQPPARSALELPTTFTSSRHAGLPETFWLVYTTRLWLKASSLKTVLWGVATQRRKNRLSSEDPIRLESQAIDAAIRFANTRRYVPIERNCLLDSLALLRYLSRRGLPASIVFGVTHQPFGAHCWIQAGDLALNETLTVANAHTPIRVI